MSEQRVTCETHRVPGNGRTIVFLSDFGYRNEWVGICHAVMNASRPRARSSTSRTAYRRSTSVTERCCSSTRSLPGRRCDRARDRRPERRPRPRPGDRGQRRPARGRARQRPARARCRALGGVRRAQSRSPHDVVLTPISPSFHARDVLAPAAAHLSRRRRLEKLGPRSIRDTRGDHDSRADDGAREDRVRGARPQPLRQRPAQRP